MNLYILVEGEKTELLLYPKWISHLIPKLTQASHLSSVKHNNFYIFSGGGIPSINNHTVNAIKEINNNPIFDFLIVCLDGEEIGIKRRKEKLLKHISDNNAILNKKCNLRIIVQNVCIETWFLGNRKIFKRNPNNEILKNYILHYNVQVSDPELMERIDLFPNRSTFHVSYLKELFKEHNLSYKKANPNEVLHSSYLNQLIKRVGETSHLASLNELFKLFEEIKMNT